MYLKTFNKFTGEIIMKFKKIMAGVLISIMSISLIGCGSKSTASQVETKNTAGKKIIKAGTSILFKDALQAAKADFEKLSGDTLEIKVFDDAIATNIALAEGSIDVNFYQHEPYLDSFNKEKGTKLVRYGKKVLASDLGMYSNKVGKLEELKDGFRLGISNDASNRAIALFFLQEKGLIKLKEGVEFPISLDVIENKKNINFVEMDRLSLVKTLDDIDAAVIPSLYVFLAGKDPKKTLISGYDANKLAIIMVTREDNKNEEWAKYLQEALTNENERKFIKDFYKGAVVPMF